MKRINEVELLRLTRDVSIALNKSGELHRRLGEVIEELRDKLGFSAIGLRVQKGIDYPFMYTSGYDLEYLEDVSSLVKVDEFGNIVCDEAGNICFSCLCGLVLSGKINNTKSYSTLRGSLWVNSRKDLLDVIADTNLDTDIKCFNSGYKSIAFIPVKSGLETVGLLQIHDVNEDRFRTQDVLFLSELCDLIAVTIVREQEERELELKSKELACIYKVSNIIEQFYPDIERILTDIANVLPESWRFPEYASAAILYKNKKYSSSLEDNSSHECLARQEVNLTVNGKVAGYINIKYTGFDSKSDDTLFLQEEWKLLTEIAHKIENTLESIVKDTNLEHENCELKAIYESTPGIIVLVDHERRIVKANAAALEMAQKSLAEVKGMRGGDALCCLYAGNSSGGCGFGEECENCVIKSTAEGVLATEIPVKRNKATFFHNTSDGVTRYDMLVSAYPLTISHSKHVLLCLEDVTEMQEKEEELRKSAEAFSNLVASLPDVVMRKDLDLRVQYVSPNITNFFDLPYELYCGKTAEELGFPDKLVQYWERIQNKVLTENKAQETQYEILTSMGMRTFNWRSNPEYDENGKIVSLINIFRDITDSVNTLDKLEQTTTLLQAALDFSMAGITILEAPTGKIRYANAAALKIRGRPVKDIVDGSCIENYINKWQIYNLDGTEILEDEIPGVRALRYGESSSKELIIRRDSGEDRIVFVHAAPVYNKNGEIVAAIVIFPDITEKNKLNEQLRQAEKMSAIGQLAGGVAHDFNNQLTGILGYADIIIKNTDDERMQEFARNIIKAANHSADLTQQLLAFSRKGLYHIQPVDMHGKIVEVIKILEHSIDKRIDILSNFEADYAIVKGDSSQLQNALLNLALNARDAISSSGQIMFRTSMANLGIEYCSSLNYYLSPGEYLKIDICDTGVGIPQRIQDKVFEPFFTTKAEGKGTGMGLAAVYGTVKYHKGAIELKSVESEGSTFSIYLPVIRDDYKDDIDGDFNLKIGKGRILLVDDEKVARDICAEMLRQLGYEVICKANGAEALAYYKDYYEELDLVLLDMIMPIMNGRETFQRMRQIDNDIKAIIISGYSSDNDIQATLNEGALDVLAKPFHLTDLAEIVAMSLR